MSFLNTDDPKKSIQNVPAGETTSYAFKAVVGRWLTASSSDLTFHGQIQYRVGEIVHSSSFEIVFHIRAPLRSNVFGAITGAFLGSSAQHLTMFGGGFLGNISIGLVANIILALITAVIAVVYSSRRSSDVQPILTVEDFWGGLLIGFFIGYLGIEFFESVIPVPGGGD